MKDQRPRVPLSDEQEGNLRRLMNHLRSLPPEYDHFEMALFCNIRMTGLNSCARGSEELLALYSRKTLPWHELPCGAAACALGHGPLAGVNPEGASGWSTYELKFIPYYREFSDSDPLCAEVLQASAFLFGADMGDYDDDHLAAAARIEWFLAHRRVPLSFRVTEEDDDYRAVHEEIGYGPPSVSSRGAEELADD